MDPFLLEFLEEIFDRLMLMDEIDRPQKTMPLIIVRLTQITDEVPAMDHAGQIIQTAPVDGQPGIMQLFETPLEIGKRQIIGGAADIEPGPHHLTHRNASELDDPFQDVTFSLRRLDPDRFIDLVAQLLDDQATFLAPKKALQAFGLTYSPTAYTAKQQMDQLDDPGSVVGELQIVLGSPDLGHDLAEKDHDEGYQYDLDEELEEPEVLFEQDHFIDQEVGQDDNGDIDDAVRDQHGR